MRKICLGATSGIDQYVKGSFIALALFLSGCGYTFQGGTTVLPPDIKRVYVPLVENNTTEVGLSTLLTEAIKDRFERFGVLTIVDEIGEADAVMRAKVLKVTRGTGAVTSNTDTTLVQDTTITIAAELKRVTGPILWRNQSISVNKSYGVQSNVVVASSSDFASSAFSGSDLSQLQAGGTREIARGQEQGALATLADQAASYIYDSAVAADF